MTKSEVTVIGKGMAEIVRHQYKRANAVTKSEIEELLAWQIKITGLPEPKRECLFWEGRRFRFDFCWPDLKIAVEVEGGTWVLGRHTRGAGFAKDCEKYNEAAILGWKVLRFPTEEIKNGNALATIKRAIAA